MNAGSGARPVRKNPSISLIWAKCRAGGVSPRSSAEIAWDGADCATWAEPSLSASIAEAPGAEMLCSGSRPSS